MLHELSELTILEEGDPNSFRVRAYESAAQSIKAHGADLGALTVKDLQQIEGVGKSTAEKIRELLETGKVAKLEGLRAKHPPAVVALLSIQGLGPKAVKRLRAELGVGSIDDLRRALAEHKLRDLKGFGEKSEEKLTQSLARLEQQGSIGRTPISVALPLARKIVARLTEVPGVTHASTCGSLRRFSETIGDVDILVSASDPERVMEAVVSLPAVDTVLGRGTSKTSILTRRGTQVDVRVVAPEQLGAALLYFTGSKGHNIKLRQRALVRGWTLNEYALSELEGGKRIAGETEEEIYRALGLPFIPPVLREDAGEIEAALTGGLPNLITLADLRGDLHSHSDWSDGHHPIELMAEHARLRGYAYQVLTDHTQSLAIARGLTPDRVAEEAEIIAALNARYEAEEQAGTAPDVTPPEGFRLLHGCELEVRADGALDYEDDLLARFDLVVASVHVARRQTKAELTQRTLNAIRSPHVDVIAHPSGRKIGQRDDLDLDWDLIYTEAARTGTTLEMNGSPPRLDLAVERARRAIGLGCFVSIDSDAHDIREMDFVRWGISQARRAWVTPDDVLNTRSRADLLAWVAGKPGRV